MQAKKRAWTKPPRYAGRTTFRVATATGYHSEFRTHRDAMEFVRTPGRALLNPTIYQVREAWTRARKQP